MKKVIVLIGALLLTTAAAELKDGVYIGKSGGHNGPLRVAVTVSGNCIAEVEVLSHKESPRAGKALTEMPRRIVRANDANVDALSGATVTADAIKSAVKHALKKAK